MMPGPTAKAALKTFRDTFGAGTRYREFTKSDETRLKKRVPGMLLKLLHEDGWRSYREQVLWTCDPDEWVPAADAWFPKSSGARIMARSAFGDLFAWDGRKFAIVLVHESLVMSGGDDDVWFFGRTLTSQTFLMQTVLPARIRAAHGTAGPLEWDEMYSYVPAIALGGDYKKSRVERVKAQEQLSILSQLVPIRRT
jgi:hypothetical protein